MLIDWCLQILSDHFLSSNKYSLDILEIKKKHIMQVFFLYFTYQ